MPAFETVISIEASIELVFDLARSVDLHLKSAADTEEIALKGKGISSGLMRGGDSVTWRAKHFGFYFEMTNKIGKYNRPFYFEDFMVKGPFDEFVHQHHFDSTKQGTMMRDVIAFKVPFGLIGELVAPVITSHLRRFLQRRNVYLKQVAESGNATDLLGLT